MRYNKYSDHLMKKYGEKVYKIPVNLPITCPNRDGYKGYGGCIYCSEVGAGFEAQSSTLDVKTQIENNIAYIGPKYHVNKFIIYFQNYTSTYMPLDQFKAYISESMVENVVGLSISTRPDSIPNAYLEYLLEVQNTFNINIEVELGLQSININTLKKINRGHGVAEFIDAVNRIHQFGFSVCTHLIGNLPWDTSEDLVEAGRVISALKIESIKLHSLYILRNTKLGDLYLNHEFEMMSSEDYLNRVVAFLKNISSEVVIQRLFGRAPESEILFSNWNRSWRKLQNELELKLEKENARQGDLYNI